MLSIYQTLWFRQLVFFRYTFHAETDRRGVKTAYPVIKPVHLGGMTGKIH
jgi:hypothetical protein